MNPYRELAIPHLPSQRGVEWCRRCVHAVIQPPLARGQAEIEVCGVEPTNPTLCYIMLVLQKCPRPTLKLAFQPRKR
jgi:hypothetical protein